MDTRACADPGPMRRPINTESPVPAMTATPGETATAAS
ncbi:hypothetical protein HPGCJGGD_3157 [Methylobacterium haplocladii]|nr:hypothetical protein HPGCJGGD_3157 [Methylobacterium haplocladii]